MEKKRAMRAVPATNLGFPRIGPRRELKQALEQYWAGKSSKADLGSAAASIRQANWRQQHALGLDHIPSNDFSLYDNVLDTAAMVGAIPERYRAPDGGLDLDSLRGGPSSLQRHVRVVARSPDTDYGSRRPGSVKCELGATYAVATCRGLTSRLAARTATAAWSSPAMTARATRPGLL